MKTVPNKVVCPPNQWRFKVPESGQLFRGPDISGLIEQLHSHYQANGWPPPPHLEELIESFVCEQEPDYCIETTPKPVSWVKDAKTTFDAIKQGTKTLARWMGSGQEKVPQAQMEARAEVCVGCSENKEIEGCSGCKMASLTSAVEYITGNHRTTHHSKLKGCAVCMCHLNAKIVLPHNILWSNMTDQQKSALPSHCWLVTEARA